MSDLELKITVRSNSNVGQKIRDMVADGDANDGVALASEGFILSVVRLERADGLSLAVEDEFSDWFSKNDHGYGSQEREIAHKAYLAGRAKK